MSTSSLRSAICFSIRSMSTLLKPPVTETATPGYFSHELLGTVLMWRRRTAGIEHERPIELGLFIELIEWRSVTKAGARPFLHAGACLRPRVSHSKSDVTRDSPIASGDKLAESWRSSSGSYVVANILEFCRWDGLTH